MKKIFTMIAAVLCCGTMMFSCDKEDTEKNNNDQGPAKTDMVGTWEGTYSGTASIGEQNENYSVTWTLTLNPEGSATIGSLKYATTFTTLENMENQVPVTDYYVRQNTNTGRIVIVALHSAGITDEMIDFDINLSAKTMTGNLQLSCSVSEDDYVTFGGETTLNKK